MDVTASSIDRLRVSKRNKTKIAQIGVFKFEFIA
jgi:hypothetical protein